MIISHIDTPEALVVTSQRAAEGENVFVVGYDYENSCETAPEVCLGVPYFNWGPEYLKAAKSVVDGNFEPQFIWSGPDANDWNNHDTSTIGFKKGTILTKDEESKLDSLMVDLMLGNKNLFTGPLNFQDGSQYIADGVADTDAQSWYTHQ